MLRVIETADSVQLAAVVSILLAGAGMTIAWLPAFRLAGGVAVLARVLVTAGLCAAVWDMRGLGGVLGLALTAMGVAAVWQGRPVPEVPRPRRTGIVISAVVTGLIVLAVLDGWWLLARLPDTAGLIVALVLGTAGALGTIAIADRSRTRLREAIRHRLYH